MAVANNHVNHRELGEAIGLMRVGGIGSCFAGDWQEDFSKATRILDEAGIRFAYVVDDGNIAEISVDGLDAYGEGRRVLSDKGISGIVDPCKAYFRKL